MVREVIKMECCDLKSPHCFSVLKVALAGGIYLGLCGAWVTIASLLGVPGFPEFTKILADIYGSYGYSVSFTGIFVGAFWGFIEGFVHLGIFAFILAKILNRK